MLDAELKQQLVSVFSGLENEVELAHFKSAHGQQAELLSMLQDVASTSAKIKVIALNAEEPAPSFKLRRNGVDTGVVFKGIPGGHEFSSLILAILNADGKGKTPDSGIIRRIKSIKGPIRVKTYISLTCENCPDVVQAMNQMALIHSDFVHEMVDGAFVQDEIQALGIQGVPSVMVGSKLLHSGKIQFLDLLTKLEEHFGVDSSAQSAESMDLGKFEVVVVGGGPAGVSAAIYSARKGLKTALFAEKIGGQVQETKGIENLISVVYTEGPELSAQLYKHLQAYPIKIFEQRRVKKIGTDSPKKIELESGEFLTADSVIVTTGAKWRELGIPGEKEYLGRGVAFCPHCDGPFYKGKKIAVVGGGNSGVEAAIDLAGIVREVVVIEYADQLKADQVLVDKLKSLPNVSVIMGVQTKEILGDGQKVNALEYKDRKSGETRKLDLDGIFVQIGLLPNSQFLKGVVELTSFGEVIVDPKGRTSVPGIYAAGDVTTTPYKQIVIAMGEGAKVALCAFEDRMFGSGKSA